MSATAPERNNYELTQNTVDSQPATEAEAEDPNRKLNCVWLAEQFALHLSAYRKLQCQSETGRSVQGAFFFLITHNKKFVWGWPRGRSNPSPAVYFTSVARVAKSREHRRLTCLLSPSSPSCGISWVSALLLEMSPPKFIALSRMCLGLCRFFLSLRGVSVQLEVCVFLFAVFPLSCETKEQLRLRHTHTSF